MLQISHQSHHTVWRTKGAAVHEQIRAIHHPLRTDCGARGDHHTGQPVRGGRITDGNSYGQMISIVVSGVDGKTSSPTEALISSSQNRTPLSLSDPSGVIGRRGGTSTLTATTLAGTIVADYFGRTRNSWDHSSFNAEILRRSTTSRLGDTAGRMTMSGVMLNGLGLNPIIQLRYGGRMEGGSFLDAETISTRWRRA